LEAIKKIISNKKAAAVLRITCYILGIITVEGNRKAAGN
jgi:hypothetical protein